MQSTLRLVATMNRKNHVYVMAYQTDVAGCLDATVIVAEITWDNNNNHAVTISGNRKTVMFPSITKACQYVKEYRDQIDKSVSETFNYTPYWPERNF